jgi:hypothetical protein
LKSVGEEVIEFDETFHTPIHGIERADIESHGQVGAAPILDDEDMAALSALRTISRKIQLMPGGSRAMNLLVAQAINGGGPRAEAVREALKTTAETWMDTGELILDPLIQATLDRAAKTDNSKVRL